MGKLTEQQWNEVRVAYCDKDESIASLSRLYDIAEQSIWKWLKRRGLLKQRLIVSPPLTLEEFDQAAELYASGMTGVEIAAKMRRSPASIYKALAEEKLTLNRGEGKLRRVSQETRDKIPALYDEEKTLDEIAVLLKDEGATRGIVYEELKRRGKELRQPGRRGKFHSTPRIRKEIVLRYARGESLSWLAIYFECSRDPIMKVLREAGIAIRSFDEAVGIQWTDRKGRVHYMKSTWEIKTAEWLDAQLVEWDYEKETFTVGRWKGHDVHYTPDFWIYRPDGTLEKLLDVKGWARPRSMWRIDKFRRTHAQPLEVWDEAVLLERKIIEPKKVWRRRTLV